MKYCTEVDNYEKLPEQGIKLETVLTEAKKIINLGNGDWKSGSESGTVYNGKLLQNLELFNFNYF